MTAINIVLGANRVDLYTDAAATGPTGRIGRLASKVRNLAGMQVVIAIRGDARALDALAAIVPELAGDYDELLAAAKSGRLRRACGPLRSLAQGRRALVTPFDLVAIGWGACGPAAFLVCNHGRHPGVTAWRPVKIPMALITPPVSLPKGARANPGAHMLGILERQRRHLEPSLLIPKGRSIVGGYAECTTVTATGISTRRVLDWPDKIGEPIGGNRDAPRAARRRLGFALASVMGAAFLTPVVWQAPALTYVARTYEGLPANAITTEAGRFDVYDRPDLGKLITVASLTSISRGLPSEVEHADAAQAWLAARGCSITGTMPLLSAEREHRYRCGNAGDRH